MLNFWGNDHANAINGSDGSIYKKKIFALYFHLY